MAWTKRQLINQAYEEIGLAAYVFDMQAEQIESALRRMDAMLAEWSGIGIRLGYNLTPEGEVDAASGISDMDARAVYTNLALSLSGARGKPPSITLMREANIAYKSVLRRAVKVIERQVNSDATPAGAGNRRFAGRQNPYLQPHEDVDAFTEEDEL